MSYTLVTLDLFERKYRFLFSVCTWCNNTVILQTSPFTTMLGKMWSLMGNGGPPLKTTCNKDIESPSCQLGTKFYSERDFFVKRMQQPRMYFIHDELWKRGCSVINAPGDALHNPAQMNFFCPIRQGTSLRYRAAVESTYFHHLIGEDTDVLILLLCHAHTETKNLYLHSDNKSKTTKVCDINCLKVIHSNKLCSYLLNISAIKGCDAITSAFKRQFCYTILLK